MSMRSKKRFQRDKDAGTGQSLPAESTDTRNLWTGFFFIAALTYLIYDPVLKYDFVNLDDDSYLQILNRLPFLNFKVLFTQPTLGNYHPLVTLVYSLLIHFSNSNPGAFHAVNLLLHIVNSGLVLWLIYYLTGSFPLSFVTGVFFGVHPLHVESVAWVSELKDLMYGLGFLASLICYVRYVKENLRNKWYLFSLLFFLFSLFSKGMAVSLTLALFVVDYYLGRKSTRQLFLEKVPFLFLSLSFGIIAISAQKILGAIHTVVVFPFFQRLVFSCYGFIIYIFKIFFPFHLYPYCPYPIKTGEAMPVVYYIYPLLVLLLLGVVFFSLRKTRKIGFGIGFFTVTILLVLQLLPFGGAITADRYCYIPSIGIFFLLAEGLRYISEKYFSSSNGLHGVPITLFTLLVLFFSGKTVNQIPIWKDSMTLWNNVIEHCQTVALPYNNRGVLYLNQKEWDKALDDFNHALHLNPDLAYIWCNIGLIYWNLGLQDKTKAAELFPKALEYYNNAIKLDPGYAIAYGNRGSLLSTMGKNEEAIQDYTKSIELDPYFAQSYFNRAIVHYHSGRKDLLGPDLKRASELGYGPGKNAYRDFLKSSSSSR
jgi:protein O-mannosyl-transferase